MELGKALLATGAGVLAAAVTDTVDRTAVLEKYQYLKEQADKQGLTKKGEWQVNIRKQAEREAVDKWGEAFE